MASPIQAQLILADAAQVDPGGKVYMLGAGWETTTIPTAPHAVVAFIKVPWDRTNLRLQVLLRLLDADGQEVRLPGPLGEQPVAADSFLEVGRPPGLAPGSSIGVPFALNLPSLPLKPASYEWRLEVAKEPFSVFFQVRGS